MTERELKLLVVLFVVVAKVLCGISLVLIFVGAGTAGSISLATYAMFVWGIVFLTISRWRRSLACGSL